MGSCINKIGSNKTAKIIYDIYPTIVFSRFCVTFKTRINKIWPHNKYTKPQTYKKNYFLYNILAI